MRFAKQSTAFAKIAQEDQLDIELKCKEQKPQTKCQRFRQRGKHALHSRIVLAIVVCLCVLDCILVIGELILDMHAIKEEASGRHGSGDAHVNGGPHGNDTGMDHNNPVFVDHPGASAHSLYQLVNSSRQPRVARKLEHDGDVPTGGSHGAGGDDKGDHGEGHHEHPIEEKIAHAFHYASITILAILVVETLFKIFFEGKEFLKKKFEMWDAFVVIVSFIIDLVFLKGITTLPIQESAYILSYILPWRVIRVVNSLVVAVLDHEHFKLLLVYKSKKNLQKQMDEQRDDTNIIRKQLFAVKALCIKAGTEEWIVNQTIMRIASQMQKKEKNALSSFASFTAGAVVDEKRIFKESVKKRNAVEPNFTKKCREIADMHTVISVGNEEPILKAPLTKANAEENHEGADKGLNDSASNTRPLSFSTPDIDTMDYADDE